MMNPVPAATLLILGAYLAGSLPFGLIAGKVFRGIDLRRHGSQNIGATNAARVLGKPVGLLVLLLDALKGLLPVWLLPLLFVRITGNSAWHLHVQVVCGVAAILGHMFPCWLGFRGGKGVATSLGVVALLSWQATLAAAAAFALAMAVGRIVSLASMLAALGFAAAYFYFEPNPFSSVRYSLTAFSLAVPLLILVRHRANITRLWRGEEPVFGAVRQETAGDDGAA